MKLAVFAHFDRHDNIKAYVLYYLEQLKQICDRLIFVSTANLDSVECSRIDHLCEQIIIRENVGHDFYSYKIGVEAIEDITKVKQLILCNDSCFGPLFPLSDIFIEMESQKVNFWSMSACSRPQFHLQSYFLVFDHKVINSQCFKSFWHRVCILQNKDQIILDYEVGLSNILIANEFIAQSFLPVTDFEINVIRLFVRKLSIYLRECNNYQSRYSWKTLLEPLPRIDKTISLFDYSIKNYQFPFLKKSLFSDHWVNHEQLFNLILQYTSYDPNLIKEVINE